MAVVPPSIKKALKKMVDDMDTPEYKEAVMLVKRVEDAKKQIADFCKENDIDIIQFKSLNKLIYKAEFKKTTTMRVVVPTDEREKYLTPCPMMRATYTKYDPTKQIEEEDF
jgi:hypothetical protein